MLNLYKHQNLKVLAVFLTISFLFCCGSAWYTMIFGNHHDMTMADHCTAGSFGASANEMSHPPMILTSGLLNNLLNQNLFFTFIILSILILLDKKYLNFKNYWQKIRRWRGNAQIFNKYNLIFSSGILHPQIFA